MHDSHQEEHPLPSVDTTLRDVEVIQTQSHRCGPAAVFVAELCERSKYPLC